MSAIGSISGASSLAQAQVAQKASLSVAGKVQDAAKAEGEAVVSSLQEAAALAKQAPREVGKGEKIDVHG